MPLVADERFLFGIELNPTFQSARGLDFDGDSFRFNFSTLLKIKDTDDLTWVLGANIRPEYDFVAVPIFGFNYHVNDKLYINLVSDSPNISYQILDKTKVILEFDYTLDEFEVTSGSNEGAILQIQDFATGLGLEHHFNDHLLASIGVGGVFNRILKFQNETGKALLDDGLYMSLKVSAEF